MMDHILRNILAMQYAYIGVLILRMTKRAQLFCFVSGSVRPLVHIKSAGPCSVVGRGSDS